LGEPPVEGSFMVRGASGCLGAKGVFRAWRRRETWSSRVS
jgi:hypothetical protein